jgi:hypothetical protein
MWEDARFGHFFVRVILVVKTLADSLPAVTDFGGRGMTKKPPWFPGAALE